MNGIEVACLVLLAALGITGNVLYLIEGRRRREAEALADYLAEKWVRSLREGEA
jgi:hypothetical protein